MSSFHVDTAALRAAAGQVSTVGSGITTAAGTVTSSVQGGTLVNEGYATSAALESFASQLATSMGTAGRGVDEHAQKLTGCADRYDSGEADNVALFRM